ncbi:hypothetical protein, partial [Metapseudomonas resinovorans]|uniref:hypothetical protein n=1 Tax=Metapseudomonas resinovorans TaxID=53412 RepID=UPI0025573F54
LHKHPHELLDSVVKERFDQVFRLNRGRAFYSSLSYCQAVFRKSLFYSTACASDPIHSSRQREAHSTAFKLAVNTSVITFIHSFRKTEAASTTATDRSPPPAPLFS